VLENLSKQVRDCMLQAEQCAFRAKIEPDPVVARERLNMERRCLSLARCLEFQERLQSFSSHNKKTIGSPTASDGHGHDNTAIASPICCGRGYHAVSVRRET